MRYLALLRGVNVGGRNLVKIAELRAALDALGLADVRTLLQSGNAVFDAPARAASRLERDVQRAVLDRCGVDSMVFVRTFEEWRAALDANPFTAEAGREPGRVHLLTLRRPPAAGALRALRAAIPGRERVEAGRRHAYLYYPDGQGRSRLTPAILERHLGPGTARNWNTSRKLADLAS